MRASRFEHTSRFPVPVGTLWKAHMRPGALRRLTPWPLGLESIEEGRGVADGSVVRFRVGQPGFRQEWTVVHSGVRPRVSFVDTALASPFRYWVHQHLFCDVTRATSELRDVVHFVPPRWLPGASGRFLVRLALRVLFTWRHRVTRGLVRESDAGPAALARLQRDLAHCASW